MANRFFPNQKGLVLLCIDSDRVKAEIKYEGLETQELFPHIYGELNLDAVFAESGGVFTERKNGGVALPPPIFERVGGGILPPPISRSKTGVSPSDRHAGFYNGGNPRNEPAQLERVAGGIIPPAISRFKTKVLDFEPNANGKFDLPKQLADDI